MLIDKNKMLVQTAISGTPSANGKYWLEFYRVDGILKLRDLQDVTLVGHPGIDLQKLPDINPADYIFHKYASWYEASKLNRWIGRGRMVAISEYRRRNRQYYDLIFSWCKPEDYLSQEEMFWLESYIDTSFDYTSQLEAMVAIADLFKGLWQECQKPKKQKSLKAKQRRRRDRERNKPIHA